jgi:cytochrome bd-type quinol oxidase subunit 2
MNTYTFTSKVKKNLIIAFVVGLVIFGIGILANSSSGANEEAHHEEGHAKVLTNNKQLLAVVEFKDSVATTAATTTEVSHTDADAHATTATPAEHSVGEHKAAEHGEAAHAETHEKGSSLRAIIISNVYTVILFAFWIGITALFFLSGATLALGGWQIQIQKIPLAIASTLPVTIALMVFMFVFFNHDIFEWTHSYLFDKSNPAFDEILYSKRDYLNLPRFTITAVILFSLSLGILYAWWTNLKKQAETPSIKLFDKSRAIAAASIVIIAMLINTFGSWDWAMSIQPHWYSTMFSWYLFASAAVSMFSITMLMIIYLKSNGYLPKVNDNHRHDIGKLMFAISVFWTYVWFSQYMLIWYTNFPEETLYFTKRLNGYPVLFYLTIVVNFILPFLVLIKRDSKRSITTTAVMAVIIIVGHWFDYFSVVVPELVPSGGFGLIGVGAFIMMGSVFTFTMLNALSKVKDLESSTHPFVRESYQHNI